MDFFEAQARAKKRTSRLVALFALAVLGTVLAGYVATLGIQSQLGGRVRRSSGFVESPPAIFPVEPWQPGLFLAVAVGTLAVVGLAALYKWNKFSAGGSAVAESVGARRVAPASADPQERRLLNVVEEMALASGIPVPATYVLESEPGINAFAAGLTTGDAAVCVTRGTLEKLSRDELQGVVGHEFSHILNGDMRLNLRLAAIVFGILVIGLAGRGILWSLRHTRVRASRDGKNSGGILVAIVAAGLALMLIGFVGYFFGRLIQAAVSRQREFLADASAVQFTRNPGGITGALKKIGGYALGSTVIGQRTAELNHFFFAQGFRSSFGGAWATHPPLDERIRAIDPSFDGKMFDPPEVVDVEQANFLEAGFAPTLPARFTQPKPLPRRVPFRPAAVVANIGTLATEHFQNSQTLLSAIPAPLRAAARDPAQAPALIYALLLSDNPATRSRQLTLVAQHDNPSAADTLQALLAATNGTRGLGEETSPVADQSKFQNPNSKIPPEARLPLLQLALPALRTLDAATLDRFLGTLDELVHADGTVTPFEFALQKMLARQLGLARDPSTVSGDIQSFAYVVGDIAVVLSTLARADSRDAPATKAAFAAGAAQLKLIESSLTLLAPSECGLAQLDAALDKLATTSPVIKQRLLIAAAQTIGADGTISPAEGELFRTLAAALDVPMPQLEVA
jgi:Zn-dependent protease with chaperone function